MSDVVKYSIAKSLPDHQARFEIAGAGRWIAAKAVAGGGIARRRVKSLRDAAATCRKAHLPRGSAHAAADVGPLRTDLFFEFFSTHCVFLEGRRAALTVGPVALPVLVLRNA